MKRFSILVALLAGLAIPAALLPGSPAGTGAVSSPPQLLAFGGHFSGFHLGGRRGFAPRRVGFGGFGRRGSSRSLLRRIARAVAFAYILHLLFSHGGISIVLWLLIIGLAVHVMRRRRVPRNRHRY